MKKNKTKKSKSNPRYTIYDIRYTKSSSGFTLLEVMIAITILASMSLALFSAFSQMLGSQDLTEARDHAQHSIAFALDKMTHDIQSAYIVKSGDFLGTNYDGEIAFEGTGSRLDFVSFSHLRFIRDAPESESAEISYYLEQNPEDPDTYLLMRRESPAIDKDLQNGGRAFPLLEGIRDMRLEYLPARNDEWKNVWDTKSIDSAGQLPRAVKIELEFILPDESESRRFSMIAPIRLRKPVVW